MTTRLIPVRYVGRKQTAFDNVARSGVTWNGHGDVQEVTDAQAKLLIKFPDQWELADAADIEAVNAPVSINVVDEDGDRVAVDPEALTKPLEKMSKAELAALAKDRWGKHLDARWSTKRMIDQIEEWQHDLDVTAGPRAD